MNTINSGLQQALKAERNKRQKAEREAWIRKAYASFLKDYETAEEAIVSSTKASWGGSGYSLELFPDGDFRVLWDNHIGSLYDSPGVIVPIPTLGEDEYDSDNGEHCFDNALDRLDELIEEIIRQ